MSSQQPTQTDSAPTASPTTPTSIPSSAEATAPPGDVPCTGSQGPNPAAPEFYRGQYDLSIAESLRKDLTLYHSAVASGVMEEIGLQAGRLYSEISVDLELFDVQSYFGCYDPAVLTSLHEATDALAPVFDDISSAAANFGGKSPGEVPGLVSRAKPLEKVYVDSLNLYASQFGGEQV
jgi:hypothetical protein